jgi:glycine/D-amino acid oxidase-like deaminating enzyme
MREATVVGGGAGVFAVSPDEFPLLGPIGAAEGLYGVADTGGYGMTCSPGLGRALAETIVSGSTFTDISPFRPSRFADGRPLG